LALANAFSNNPKHRRGQTQRSGGRLGLLQDARGKLSGGPVGTARIVEERDPRLSRNDLLQQLEALRAEIRILKGEAGDISTRVGEACRESGADRITHDPDHDGDASRDAPDDLDRSSRQSAQRTSNVIVWATT